MASADELNDWVKTWLSPGRWQRYLDHCAGDAGQALALYERNVNLSGAVMHDVAHIEVAIRNVYDAVEVPPLLVPAVMLIRSVLTAFSGKRPRTGSGFYSPAQSAA